MRENRLTTMDTPKHNEMMGMPGSSRASNGAGRQMITGEHDKMMGMPGPLRVSNGTERRRLTAFGAALPFLALLLPSALTSCSDEFDPPSLLSNLRVLAISAEPADLAPGESTVIQALVVEPDGQPVEYAWEWCPFTRGPNAYYECLTEELGLPAEALALFDLGDAPEAVLAYPGDPGLLQGMCEAIRAASDDLPSFIELPDCERGLDVTIRLVVSTPGLERIAVRDLFIWFVEPQDQERNANPVIERVLIDGSTYRRGLPIDAEPGQRLGVQVVVAESSAEPYTLTLAEGQTEERREDLIFSFFTTAGGKWDRFRSFADLTQFSLLDAGYNILKIETDTSSPSLTTHMVVRDERGGVAWTDRVVRIASP